MAKLNEEVLIVKISTITPDGVDSPVIMNDENVTALKQVIEQLASDNPTLVEIEKA